MVSAGIDLILIYGEELDAIGVLNQTCREADGVRSLTTSAFFQHTHTHTHTPIYAYILHYGEDDLSLKVLIKSFLNFTIEMVS